LQPGEQPPVAVNEDQPAGTDLHALQLDGVEHYIDF
jgi:hypothetical protein